jgi:hypothetical protein
MIDDCRICRPPCLTSQAKTTGSVRCVALFGCEEGGCSSLWIMISWSLWASGYLRVLIIPCNAAVLVSSSPPKSEPINITRATVIGLGTSLLTDC